MSLNLLKKTIQWVPLMALKNSHFTLVVNIFHSGPKNRTDICIQRPKINLVSTYHFCGLGFTSALQVVRGEGVIRVTGGVVGELRWENWIMDGVLQEVVQTTVGPVVWSGTNAKKICLISGGEND